MIDAHFHIWQLARADYGWLTPAQGAIYRDVTLADWRRASAPCGITGGVLVQAAPTAAETRFLLEQAGSSADVLGVIGWVDMLAPDAGTRVRTLAGHPRLKGLRPMLQDIADPDWILQAGLHDALQAMCDVDLVFDALVKPVHLPRILALSERYPCLRIVIDHAAKPDIANRQWQDWAIDMQRLARLPGVYCKLSGLWNEAAPSAGVEALVPYLHHAIACFGPHRLLWGSDWPVLERAGSYAAWHSAALRSVAATDQAAVFGDVAKSVYKL